MTRPRLDRLWLAVLLVWLAVCAPLVAIQFNAVSRRLLSDPDDFLRLLQVRDLLAGQSWFDVTQYRVGDGQFLPMHWSRLVDVPLVAAILLARPFLGATGAETFALLFVPLLTMLALLAVTKVIVTRLHGPQLGPIVLGCLFAASAPLVLAQINPGRIDHHGWQIVLGAAILAALLQPNPRRSGLCAGLAAGLLLVISIEGAPAVVAALAVLSTFWLARQEDGRRLEAMALSLAASTWLASLLFSPASRWSEIACDAIVPMHLQALALGAIGLSVLVRFAGNRTLPARLLGLGAVGGIAALPILLTAPQCVTHPFGVLDPLVSQMWLANISEAQPFWRQPLPNAVAMLAFPVTGLVGAVLALRAAEDAEARRRWRITLSLGLLLFLVGALMMRAAGTAQVVAVPGAIVLASRLRSLSATRLWERLRPYANALGIVALSPVGPLWFAAAVAPARAAEPDTFRSTSARQAALRKLAALPPQRILTGIDIAPELLLQTRHSTYAAGYHRLQDRLKAEIELFTGPAAPARAFMARNGLRYVLVSRRSGEFKLYASENKHGFGAQLAAGHPPTWLQPIPLGSNDIRLYRRLD